MGTYHITGTVMIPVIVEIDEEIEAEDKEEALEEALGNAVWLLDQDTVYELRENLAEWDNSADVEELKEEDEEA